MAFNCSQENEATENLYSYKNLRIAKKKILCWRSGVVLWVWQLNDVNLGRSWEVKLGWVREWKAVHERVGGKVGGMVGRVLEWNTGSTSSGSPPKGTCAQGLLGADHPRGRLGASFCPFGSASQPLRDRSSSQQRCEGERLVLVLLCRFPFTPSFFFSLPSDGSTAGESHVCSSTAHQSPSPPSSCLLMSVADIPWASSVY